MKSKEITEQSFICEIELWTSKGHYPLEKITFINLENNEKLVAILSYCDLETNLYLNGKSYKNYQSALTKVGSLFDKANIKKNQDDYMELVSCISHLK
jgi:hypothetical protein